MLNTGRFELSRLRALRRFIRPERPPEERETLARMVCIASGKGGTGKSVLSTNLAVLRAARGERVLLLDFDVGLANAHLLLGLAPKYDLGHVLEGKVSASDALVRGPGGLSLLSGGVGRHALASPTRRELDRLFRALRPLERDFELIIVDHGAGLGYGMVAHLAATRALILVTTGEVTALSDAYAVYKRALAVNPEVAAGLVINHVTPDSPEAAAWERFRDVSQRFLGRSPELLGGIPRDEAVMRSVKQRRAVARMEPSSPAVRAMERIASWSELDRAAAPTAFYDRARSALR